MRATVNPSSGEYFVYSFHSKPALFRVFRLEFIIFNKIYLLFAFPQGYCNQFPVIGYLEKEI